MRDVRRRLLREAYDLSVESSYKPPAPKPSLAQLELARRLENPRPLSKESQEELEALRDSFRSETRMTEDRRRIEGERLQRYAKQKNQMLDYFERSGRFFATRAGRVWHRSIACPALMICELEEIVYVQFMDDRADRDCERC